MLKEKADVLKSHPGLSGITGTSGRFPSIDTGDAARAETLLSEFKASIKKQGLELAREGGSIGQMTEKEWPIVEEMVAKIDPVKLGVEGTRDQIDKVVAFAESLTKRAQSKYNNVLMAMPDEIQSRFIRPDAGQNSAEKIEIRSKEDVRRLLNERKIDRATARSILMDMGMRP